MPLIGTRDMTPLRAAAPLIQVLAPVRNLANEVVLILGIDPLSEIAFHRYGPESDATKSRDWLGNYCEELWPACQTSPADI